MTILSSSTPMAAFCEPLQLSTDLLTGRVSLAGELDRTVAHRVLEACAALTASGAQVWTVDVAGLTFCDVEGQRALIRAARLAERSGRELHLLHPRPVLVRMLTLVGMGRLVGSPVPVP
ncbi:STAS domain-containing protein [Blastococcus sp. TF02-8]|uniref:STAS domain-containing protein n=1 Tax=Blastococcus sp. TF02-8 TaxID=2250574 RepID=UPI001411E04D|nr:STAS domain-containing protein [Blastococcus sp. TF02-8]